MVGGGKDREGMSEVELNKRTKEEKLIIANTLIDSVASEIGNNTIKKLLNDCMVTITDCIDIISNYNPYQE